MNKINFQTRTILKHRPHGNHWNHTRFCSELHVLIIKLFWDLWVQNGWEFIKTNKKASTSCQYCHLLFVHDLIVVRTDPMGGRKYSGGSEGRPSRKRFSDQNGSPNGGGRFQRRGSKGGKRSDPSTSLKQQKHSPETTSRSSTSSQGSIDNSAAEKLEDQASNAGAKAEYFRLFKIIKRSKFIPLKDDLCFELRSTRSLLTLVQLCTSGAREVINHSNDVPRCWFEDELLGDYNLPRGSNIVQAIGLGIRLKEMLAHI